MCKVTCVLFVFFVGFFAQTSSGQNVSYPKPVKKLINQANEYDEIDEFDKALPFFRKADSLFPHDASLNFHIGFCLFKIKQETTSLPYLETARKLGYSNPDMEWMLGVAYHLSHRFDEAIASFELYKKQTDPKKIDPERLEEMALRIKQCGNGKKLVKNPVEVQIRNLGPGVNSPFPDYVPAISADETMILFTSRRNNTTGGKTDPHDNHYFEDIYISTKQDTSWTPAANLSGYNINTPTHDACAGLSPDGQKMFIYRAVGGRNLSGDLFVSDLKGNMWTEPVGMGPNINSPDWEPSISITPDENVVFFTSNKAGGMGGRDIYASRRLPNGTWGQAINLGPKVNTENDEDAPFIHPDGKTLYFSSTGHNSMGGFDIFYTTVDMKDFSVTDPINIGYPINTADDDIYFVWSADGKRAYFSSERAGGYGEKDLYVLYRKEAETKLVVYKGKVLEGDSMKPLAATISVVDNANGQQIGVYNSNSSSGKFTVILPPGKNYGISVESQGFLFYSKNVDIPVLEHYQEIYDTILLQKVEKGKKIILRNIFFDSNKADLKDESKTELDLLLKTMNEYPNIRVRITAHCDSDGEDAYNLRLSGHRAKSVMNYLTGKGLSPKRLESKGYGETMPIAPNDTPENKARNRRTEFEIIE